MADKFHRACSTGDVPLGEMRAFRVNGTKLVVYHLGTGFYATQANCTHMFAPLARGKILDDCRVQCPLHRARFDIASGEVQDWASFPPGIQLLDAVRGEKKLTTYVVDVRDDEVFVRV